MRVHVNIDNGGDLHNFAMQYAKSRDIRMRQAYGELLEHGREAVEAEESASVEDTLDEDGESPLTADEEDFVRDIAEEMPNDEPIDEQFDDFHGTVRERAEADDRITGDIDPILVRWHIVHYY
jgi:hypothetical protein